MENDATSSAYRPQLGPLATAQRSQCVVCVLFLVSVSGCTSYYQIPTRDITHPANATPSPGAKPASEKWQGPWKENSVGSGLRATFYYGPWQCNRRWMASCERECAAEGYALMGCMWLADIKYDWRAPVMPIEAGSRYALWHCCCDYPTLTPAEKKPLRDQWESKMDSLRKKWADIYGDWPKTGGVNWPGHHMHDLFHGGAPTDLGNVMPAPNTTHGVFNKQYPKCYEGGAPWNTVGPDLPYTDQ